MAAADVAGRAGGGGSGGGAAGPAVNLEARQALQRLVTAYVSPKSDRTRRAELVPDPPA